MLQSIWNDEGMESENVVVGSTTGCGCCSYQIYGKESVIEELKKNMTFILNSCEILGITLDDLK